MWVLGFCLPGVADCGLLCFNKKKGSASLPAGKTVVPLGTSSPACCGLFWPTGENVSRPWFFAHIDFVYIYEV